MNPGAVLKFGGSSLANSQKLAFIARKIKKISKKYKKIIIVLSAPANITDNLLELSSKFKQIPSATDMLMSAGETISISMMEMALNSINVKSKALNPYQAGIITDSKHLDANILYIKKEGITRLLDKNIIPVIAGFIGISEKFELTTLGRGGSDYTAVYLSDVFKSDCFLYSDIKGVYSANPSKIENAIKLDEISYVELFEITKVDSCVRQNKAMRYAEKKNISLHLGSIFSNESPTLIRKKTREDIRIKYLSINYEDEKTTINFIGENISKNKNIIDKIKSSFNKIEIESNHRIKSELNRYIEKEELIKIYNYFINPKN
ncbi:MAG: hypothetical protein K6357_04635 [Elusimicrobiota bacterium]